MAFSDFFKNLSVPKTDVRGFIWKEVLISTYQRISNFHIWSLSALNLVVDPDNLHVMTVAPRSFRNYRSLSSCVRTKVDRKLWSNKYLCNSCNNS